MAAATPTANLALQSASSASLFSWPFQQTNQLTVAGVGFWLGLAGMALTLAGFAMTYWQLRKTRTAAQEAKLAVSEVKLRIAQYDAVHDLSEAEYALTMTSAHIGNGSWKDAISTYEDVMRASLRVKTFVSDKIDNDTNAEIDQMITRIGRFCKSVDLSIGGAGNLPNPANSRDIIRKQSALLTRVRHLLSKKV